MDRSVVSTSLSPNQPRRAVPHYFLYGEHASRAAPGFVHIETLSSRSAPHNWEIAPHLHDGLQQVMWVREGGGEARLDRDRVAFVAPARGGQCARHADALRTGWCVTQATLARPLVPHVEADRLEPRRERRVIRLAPHPEDALGGERLVRARAGLLLPRAANASCPYPRGPTNS
jgi:hypothetical protein